MSNTITGIIGDSKRIAWTVTDLAAGQLIVQAWLTIKKRLSDLDVDAVITQKSITTTATANGQITDQGADETGGGYFDLSASDTRLLTAQKEYHYDIQILTSTGVVQTPIKDVLTFEQDVTRATS